MNIKYINNFLSVSILIVFSLVIFSIVPNSFSISLIGFGLCCLLRIFKNSGTLLDEILNKITPSRFFILFSSWIALIMLSGCINAWARFISPGYDLYWFTQAISQASQTGILQTSSERFYKTILMQHWEPILYSAIPFIILIKSSVASMLWQSCGFLIGAFGAYKVSDFLFQETNYPKVKYATTALYGISFATINPLSFDIHPPVFGGLLFIPWIIYFILAKKNKFIAIGLILLLAQCGEVFIAIFSTYLAYFFVEKKYSIPRIILSLLTISSGYFILSYYQKFIGPWWSGLPYNYAARYQNIGGDGFGIISNFIHQPFYVLSQILEIEKIKTFLKIIFYNGPFFLFALTSHRYRTISIFILLGCLPYFLQAGLTSYNLMYATNTHYIGAIGSQWWALTVLGIHSFIIEKRYLKLNLTGATIIFMIFFLNSSEWRKSPLYPIRGLFEREMPSEEVRNYFSQLDKSKGIIFVNTEWLCPIPSAHHRWIICNDAQGYFDKMNLNVVVAREGSLEDFFNKLSLKSQNSENGKKLKELINQIKNNSKETNWDIKVKTKQTSKHEAAINYTIFERN